jgi:hypothetical protein
MPEASCSASLFPRALLTPKLDISSGNDIIGRGVKFVPVMPDDCSPVLELDSPVLDNNVVFNRLSLAPASLPLDPDIEFSCFAILIL